MMKRQGTSPSKKPILRRGVACCLALLGLWLMTLTAPSGSPLAWLSNLGGSSRLVTAALAAQLGVPPSSAAAEDTSQWPRLLLSESSILSGWQRGGGGSVPLPSGEGNEEEDPKDLEGVPQSQVVEKFFKASDSEGYARTNGIYIQNRTAKTLDVAAIAALSPEITLTPSTEPQILIMHTHGSEAFTQEGADVYKESGTARTIDPTYNIIRVGDEIERIFTEMGLSVLHDRTLYDYPNYNGSYERSKAAVEQYLKAHPSIKIVLDIHRDALVGQDGTIYKAVTEIDGAKTAQVLFVMGSDDGGLPHPNWQKNLSLAMRIQHRMNTLWPGLARPITLRSSRFSQELTNGSLLVEVGSHGNTLQEALAGARLFARSAGQVFLELQG